MIIMKQTIKKTERLSKKQTREGSRQETNDNNEVELQASQAQIEQTVHTAVSWVLCCCLQEGKWRS